MSAARYRHDNSALTEQRVAQILSEARAAMKAVDAPQAKVNIIPCHTVTFLDFRPTAVLSWK